MSRIADRTWEIERERRHQAYLNRIRSTTSEFVERYESILDDVRSQSLERYVVAEFRALDSALQQLRGLLSSDPERARDESRTIASDVHALPRMAREAQRHALELERHRQRQLGMDLQTLLDGMFGDITDPVEREFAYVEAATLRDDLKTRLATGTSADRIRQDVAHELVRIRAWALCQATKWKAGRRQAAAAEVHAEVLRETRATALAAADRNPAALRLLSAAWDAVQDTGSESEFQDALAAASAQADNAIVNEECRRTAVRAIFESLQKAGFAVEPPRRETGEADRVVILARKPSGRQAEFRVDLGGELSYKFDQYEGSACKQDIDQVLPMLQKIYGINLSDERIRWENPDRLSRDARPLDNQEGYHG
jgi:hypothetical protein